MRLRVAHCHLGLGKLHRRTGKCEYGLKSQIGTPGLPKWPI
jgi:hypothetical protein